jgi:hypothetical protein
VVAVAEHPEGIDPLKLLDPPNPDVVVPDVELLPKPPAADIQDVLGDPNPPVDDAPNAEELLVVDPKPLEDPPELDDGEYVVPAFAGNCIVGPAAPPNFSCVRPYALIPITAPIAI